MNAKKKFFSFILVILLSHSSFMTYIYSCQEASLSTEEEEQQFIQALASLVFHIRELKNEVEDRMANTPQTEENRTEGIIFSEEDVATLWNKIKQFSYKRQIASPNDFQMEIDCRKAYKNYYKAHCFIDDQELIKTKKLLNQSFDLLSSIWIEESSQSLDLFTEEPLFKMQISSPFFKNNPVISSQIRKMMQPYIIPNNHPMKKQLDAIFYRSRATLNEETFAKTGFMTLCTRPRSFIKVASHSSLPGYLVKANLDSELREKRGKPSWRWLVNRCEGAAKIHRIIEKKKIKHFTVAKKWIYPFPAEPAPPRTPKYTRHLALLLVTDMHLVPKEANHHAWYHVITKKHLDELYTVISYAKGSSYRPDNISYTATGQFAFIDTEYPSQGPDFKGIKKYLRPDMLYYWENLVKRGGNIDH